MTTIPTVVGIDVSLTSTGLATIHPDGQADVSRATSTGKADATLEQRYLRIDLLASIIVEAVPPGAIVGIEGSVAHAPGNPHDRSWLWGLVVTHLKRRGHPVTEFAPAQIKMYATGSGSANKDAVVAATVRRYPDADLRNNDEVDAFNMAAMLRRHLGAPIETKDMPADNLRPFVGGKGSGKGRNEAKIVRWEVG